MPRLRQAVLAARDLDATVERLTAQLRLGAPYRDPLVSYFGLANAVFAIGDTFLEVVSPVDQQIPGARTAMGQLDRSGADVCGYMAMFQVDELAAARERVRAASVREVFEIELEDIAEVHLHPGDMAGAIVALTEPRPPASWRWGGEDWAERSVPGTVAGITVAVAEPGEVSSRWTTLAGGPLPQCRFALANGVTGIVAIDVERDGTRHRITPVEL